MLILSHNGLVRPFEYVDATALAALRKIKFKLTVNFAVELLLLMARRQAVAAAPRPQPGADAGQCAG